MWSEGPEKIFHELGKGNLWGCDFIFFYPTWAVPPPPYSKKFRLEKHCEIVMWSLTKKSHLQHCSTIHFGIARCSQGSQVFPGRRVKPGKNRGGKKRFFPGFPAWAEKYRDSETAGPVGHGESRSNRFFRLPDQMSGTLLLTFSLCFIFSPAHFHSVKLYSNSAGPNVQHGFQSFQNLQKSWPLLTALFAVAWEK